MKEHMHMKCNDKTIGSTEANSSNRQDFDTDSVKTGSHGGLPQKSTTWADQGESRDTKVVHQ